MAALVAELTAVKNCLQRALQKGVRESVVLVFGNESCDLDSACCSIVYALFAQQKRENKDEIVAPVLNLKREQFLSRTEVVFWLDRVLLNNSGRSSSAVYDEACARLLDSLIFIDDIDFGQIDTFRQLKVKMMDHNRLIDAQKFLEPYVDEIIDHHEVSGSAHPWSNAVRTEIVHPVGSCASLITRRLRDEWPSMPSSVALLLYGAIVLDTSALLNSNKTTDIDVSAVEYLESKYSGVEGWPGRSYTDAMLIEAKMDVSRMSAFDIFGKDFKSVPGSQPPTGMSTAPMSVEDLALKVAAQPDCFKLFCRINSLAALVVLTFPSNHSASGKTKKLLIYSLEDEDVCSTILRAFGGESDTDLKLKLCRVEGLPTNSVKAYSVRCSGVSRKRLLPMLERSISS